MPITLPEITDMDGALRRGEGGWYWADGRFEPRVRDRRLEELIPHWQYVHRGRRGWVEIPLEWRSRIEDPELIRAVTELVRHYADIGPIGARGSGQGRRSGYQVPLTAWRVIMHQPCGATWDAADDETIRALARQQLRHQPE